MMIYLFKILFIMSKGGFRVGSGRKPLVTKYRKKVLIGLYSYEIAFIKSRGLGYQEIISSALSEYMARFKFSH